MKMKSWQTDYVELIARSIKQTSDNSQLVYFCRLKYLCSAFDELQAGRLKISEYKKIFDDFLHTQRMLRVPEVPDDFMIVDCGDMLCFDSEYYISQVEKLSHKFEHNMVELESDALSAMEPGWYLYVVSTSKHIIIYDEPFEPIQSIFRRNGTDFPTHDMLANQCGLKVIGAGEFYLSKAGTKPAIILTNKSGHFRPNEKYLHISAQVFSNTFSLNETDEVVIDFNL